MSEIRGSQIDLSCLVVNNTQTVHSQWDDYTCNYIRRSGGTLSSNDKDRVVTPLSSCINVSIHRLKSYRSSRRLNQFAMKIE